MQQELKAEDCNGGTECANNAFTHRQSFTPMSTLYSQASVTCISESEQDLHSGSRGTVRIVRYT